MSNSAWQSSHIPQEAAAGSEFWDWDWLVVHEHSAFRIQAWGIDRMDPSRFWTNHGKAIFKRIAAIEALSNLDIQQQKRETPVNYQENISSRTSQT